MTIIHSGGTGSGTLLGNRLGTFTYGYDVKGNISAIAESGSVARSRSYQLDAIERLVEVGDATANVLEAYTLDGETGKQSIRQIDCPSNGNRRCRAFARRRASAFVRFKRFTGSFDPLTRTASHSTSPIRPTGCRKTKTPSLSMT